jgi:hypothetical protein
VYALRGSLLAVPFDLATLRVTGGSVPVIEGVRRSTAQVSGAALYAFSDSGSMVYVPGPISEQEAVVIYDRQGVAQALPLPPGSYRYPRVSPDGSQVAFDSSDNKESFVSVYTLSGTTAPPRIRSAATTATRSGRATANTWRFNRTGRGLPPCSGRRSAAGARSA